MRVLVACEESQVVCLAFRALGHEAYSCDVQECSGGNPEWHIQGDVIPLLKDSWDMIIAFPPCTHLTSACACAWERKRADGSQQMAAEFFMSFANAGCERIAIENPVGWMNTHYRRPDQIIQPWMFGDEARKRTCLWLKGLPKLSPTKIVSQGKLYQITRKSGPRAGSTYIASYWYQAASWKNPIDRAKIRSKTFPGIAKAMAEQWGNIKQEGK